MREPGWNAQPIVPKKCILWCSDVGPTNLHLDQNSKMFKHTSREYWTRRGTARANWQLKKHERHLRVSSNPILVTCRWLQLYQPKTQLNIRCLVTQPRILIIWKTRKFQTSWARRWNLDKRINRKSEDQKMTKGPKIQKTPRPKKWRVLLWT